MAGWLAQWLMLWFPPVLPTLVPIVCMCDHWRGWGSRLGSVGTLDSPHNYSTEAPCKDQKLKSMLKFVYTQTAK